MSFLDFPPPRASQKINPSTLDGEGEQGENQELDESLTVSEKMRDMDKLLKNAKQNDEIGYFGSSNTKGSLLPVTVQDIDEKRARRKKIIIIAIIIAAVGLILGLGLGLGLKSKGEDPYHPPPPGPTHTNSNNAFYVSQSSLSSTGAQTFTLTRDPLADPIDTTFVRETLSNKFINEITLKASLAQQSSVRMQFGSFTPESEAAYLAQTQDLFGKQDLSSDELSMNTIGFSVATSSSVTQGKLGDEKKTAFSWKIFDKVTDKQFINTDGHSFYAMTHYLELGFTVPCRGIAGLGERKSDLVLKDGTYTLFNQPNNLTDSGVQGMQGYGSHPFLMCQQDDRSFMGLFIYNTYPMDIAISSYPSGVSQKNITIKAIGGIIDLFVFQGPQYSDVIKQYQKIIGKPRLPPYQAHGYHTRSRSFTTTDGVINAIKGYQAAKLPLESVGLTADALTDGANMQLKFDLSKVISQFPNTKFIIPLTYFVPFTATDQIKSLQQLQSIVSVTDGTHLEVTVNNTKGICIDFFLQNSYLYFSQIISKDQVGTAHGFWLDDNTPIVSQTNVTDTPESNPFYYLTYLPGNKPLSTSSLPIFAQHSALTLNAPKISHLEAHSKFGTVMARSIQQATSTLSRQNPSFIISDSTFPGAGQIGVAHVFPKNNGSWDDLKQTLSGMIAFNMFGIPNVGTNLCGFYAVQDKELCQRYYQLSVVSPVAVHNQDSFSDTMAGILAGILPSVQASLNKRMMMMLYMRTSLYRISEEGGSLLRPVFADYPLDDNVYGLMGDSVMYGEHVRVEFAMSPGQNEKNVYFPGQEWLDLDTFTVFKPAQFAPNIHRVQTTVDSVKMFQRGNGTIIPLQDVQRHSLMSTEDTYRSPFMLSVFLDNTIQSAAQGYIQMDTPMSKQNATSQYRYFAARARNGIISFTKQNKDTQNEPMPLEKLIITNAKTVINASCAILNNYWSTIPLYVSTWDPTNMQVNITTYDPSNPQDQRTVDLGKVAFIFYGALPPGVPCGQNLFQMKEEQVYQFDSQTYFARISQSMKQLLGSVVFDVYLNITLLTDNSVYMHYGLTKYPRFFSPTEVYDRNFSDTTQIHKNNNLKDVLTINSFPFYFQIHSKSDHKGQIPAKVYFSTQMSMNLFHYDLNMYSVVHPESIQNNKQFFGLGERSGSFFLQDSHTYSINANDNNVDDMAASGYNLKNIFGKNGYYPVVFGRTSDGTLTAMWSITTTAQQFVFKSQSAQGRTPQITILQPSSTLEQVLIFGLNPMQTSSKLFDLITFGSLYKTPELLIQPPPEWAFGQFFTLKNITSPESFDQQVSFYKSLGFPVEGFLMEEEDLNGFNSFTFNNNLTNYTWFLDKLHSLNTGAIIQISKTGLPIQGDFNKYTQFARDQGITILKPHLNNFVDVVEECEVGRDERGDVIYVDYSHPKSIDLITKMTQDFKDSLGTNRTINFGVQLLDNDIDNDCNGDCVDDNQDSFMKGELFVVGNEEFMSDGLNLESTRVIGKERYTHNMNGLIEQIQYSQNPFYRNSTIPVFSDSIILGSGSLGFVGRIIDQHHLEDDAQNSLGIATMQTLNIMGTSTVGLKIRVSNLIDEDSVHRLTVLNSFVPFSVLDFHDRVTGGIAGFERLHRDRYMFIKYTRTQVYKGINSGYPVLAPMFFLFPNDDNCLDYTNSQFMYGPSVLVSLQNEGVGTYFPQGIYYTPSYFFYHYDYLDTPFYSSGQVFDKQMFFSYLTQGITILQDPFAEKNQYNQVNNTKDLESVNIDIHVLFDFNTTYDKIAYGDLLVQGLQNTDSVANCFTQLVMLKSTQTMTVETHSSLIDKQPSDICRFKGFTVGRLYLYNTIETKYKNVLVNGKSTVTGVDTAVNYSVFDLGSLGLHIIDLNTVQFNK